MNQTQKAFISTSLSIGIVLFTVFIIHRFLPSIVWAGIIAIATYPLYEKWKILTGKYENVAALLFTIVLGLILLLPISWLISLLVMESQWFINYLQDVNIHGGQAPDFIQQLPLIGSELVKYWNDNIGQPGGVRHILSNWHLSLTPASYYAKQVGFNIAHRSIQVGFTLLTLFFFFRDGAQIYKQINTVGEHCVGGRWYRYAEKLPSALRSTVNGTIIVGFGVGLCMGICYALVGFPAPTLTGFITACAAMIPFFVPFVFIVVSLVLMANGGLVAAALVLIWGTMVMFVADHFIKPVLIGGAIQLPFLAVLFGILGGLETLGLLGLFIGPIVMVLFITLWNEPQEDPIGVA